MASNEERAALIQPNEYRIRDGCFEEIFCDGHWEASSAPEYDTDANAVAELRAFVRARGKVVLFIQALRRLVMPNIPDNVSCVAEFLILDATPAQQCAAFDATFKDELEKIQ